MDHIEGGSAVFFSIPGFAPGHVAIFTGEKDSSGVPLIITTGGNRDKPMRKETVDKYASDHNAKILGWAKL